VSQQPDTYKQHKTFDPLGKGVVSAFIGAVAALVVVIVFKTPYFWTWLCCTAAFFVLLWYDVYSRNKDSYEAYLKLFYSDKEKGQKEATDQAAKASQKQNLEDNEAREAELLAQLYALKHERGGVETTPDEYIEELKAKLDEEQRISQLERELASERRLSEKYRDIAKKVTK